MSTADKITAVYTMNRANIVTSSAACALIIVDGGDIIHEGYCAFGAFLYAKTAGYAAVCTNALYCKTFVVVVALYNNAFGIIYKMNYAVGAGFYAKTATDTAARVDSCDIFFFINADCITGANIYTVAVAEAGKGAESVTCEIHICRSTGFRAVVLILTRICRTGAVAGYISNLFNNVGCLKSHYSRNILGSAVAAGNTERGIVGFAFGKSLGVIVTSGKSASTAVCTGKAVSDLCDFRIFFYSEEDGRKS